MRDERRHYLRWGFELEIANLLQSDDFHVVTVAHAGRYLAEHHTIRRLNLQVLNSMC